MPWQPQRKLAGLLEKVGEVRDQRDRLPTGVDKENAIQVPIVRAELANCAGNLFSISEGIVTPDQQDLPLPGGQGLHLRHLRFQDSPYRVVDVCGNIPGYITGMRQGINSTRP